MVCCNAKLEEKEKVAMSINVHLLFFSMEDSEIYKI